MSDTQKVKQRAIEGDTVGREVLSPRAACEAVRAAVAGWEGVTTHEHRFGGMAFRRGRRELGHLHGSIADLPVPRRVRHELVATGRARPHHVLPDSGWITVPMRTASEVAALIQLFRWNYERVWPSLGEDHENDARLREDIEP
jgi:hypothetical protein